MQHSLQPIATLLPRVAAGDGIAWGSLLERLGGDIRRLAFRLTGDQTIADDAVQETLLRVRRHAAAWRPMAGDEGCAQRWVLGIAANTSLELLRGRCRAHRRERRATAAPTLSPDPGAAIERCEELDGLRRELSALPTSFREPIILHHLLGLSFAEVAQHLGICENTAKTRTWRGMRRLRQQLGDGRRLQGWSLAALLSLRLTDGDGVTARSADASSGGEQRTLSTPIQPQPRHLPSGRRLDARRAANPQLRLAGLVAVAPLAVICFSVALAFLKCHRQLNGLRQFESVPVAAGHDGFAFGCEIARCGGSGFLTCSVADRILVDGLPADPPLGQRVILAQPISLKRSYAISWRMDARGPVCECRDDTNTVIATGRLPPELAVRIVDPLANLPSPFVPALTSLPPRQITAEASSAAIETTRQADQAAPATPAAPISNEPALPFGNG